jgi:hypothetical protein
MTVRSWAALAALVFLTGLTGCAVPQAREAPRGSAEASLPLFLEFDRLETLYPAGPRFDGDLVESPALQRQGIRLIRADCITRMRHLDAMGPPPAPVAESGAAIRPISVHAGAVAGIIEEMRVREHFRQLGVRVRSVGHVSLGRRIYLGPFATEGGVRSAQAAAVAAGFQAPYPRRF